jgi:precorrin-6x reductase
MEQKNTNIWEEALKDKTQQPTQQTHERILILVGAQNAGTFSRRQARAHW